MGLDQQPSSLEEAAQPPQLTVFSYYVQDTVFGTQYRKMLVLRASPHAVYQRNICSLAYLLQVPVAGVWARLCPPPMHSPLVVGDCVLTKALVGLTCLAPPQSAHVAQSFIEGE